MTPLDKEKTLEAIRKEHGLQLDRKDPIFAIITANEIILSQQTKALESFLLQQRIEIESITQEYLKEAKVLAEQKISATTQAAQKELLSTLETASPKPISPTNNKVLLLFTLLIGGIIGYSLALWVL